jgi:hypothetical protein
VELLAQWHRLTPHSTFIFSSTVVGTLNLACFGNVDGTSFFYHKRHFSAAVVRYFFMHRTSQALVSPFRVLLCYILLDAQLLLPPHRNVRYTSSLARFPASSRTLQRTLPITGRMTGYVIFTPHHHGAHARCSVLSPDLNPCAFSCWVSSQNACSTLSCGQLITTSFQSFQKLCTLQCEISLVSVHTPFHIERFPLLMRLNF